MYVELLMLIELHKTASLPYKTMNFSLVEGELYYVKHPGLCSGGDSCSQATEMWSSGYNVAPFCCCQGTGTAVILRWQRVKEIKGRRAGILGARRYNG